jgi:hypothetical protein
MPSLARYLSDAPASLRRFFATAACFALAAVIAAGCDSSSDGPSTDDTGAPNAGGGGTGGAGVAGTGGTAGAAGTTTGGSGGQSSCPSPLVAPTIAESCVADADCVLATSLVSCCGPTAEAVPTAQTAEWDAAVATYNACACPVATPCAADGTRAEDGSTPFEPGALEEPVARCRQGVCVASYVRCDAPPEPARACETAADCTFASVRPSCCQARTRGVSASEAESFASAVQTFQSACLDCSTVKCVEPSPTADDSSQAPSPTAEPTVACEAGLCVTSYAPGK